MFSVSSCSPAEIHILLPLQAVARAERIALEVGAVGHGARRDVGQADEPACGSDRHIVPDQRPANSFFANTSFCSRRAVHHQQVGVAAGQHASPPMLTAGLREEAVGRHLDRARQLHAADLVVLRRGEHAGLDVGLRARRAWPAAGCTFSPSKRGSSVSTRRLNGAYFSRAIRSQVSSTASKVSREWSAKRARVAQRLDVEPVVEQEVDGRAIGHGRCGCEAGCRAATAVAASVRAPATASEHLEHAGRAHAAADAHRHHDALGAAALAFDQRVAGEALAADTP